MTKSQPRSASSARNNSFDLLRLIAALMVLVSHSFPLVGDSEPEVSGESFGSLGVIVFFSISGYLVTKSWCFDARLPAFAAKRALRLLPALAVTVLVTAYVIGPIVTTDSLGAYLGSTEPVRYVLDNIRLSSQYSLPGVFETTPFEGVNGSLWTLPVEVKAYLLIALLGCFRSLRRALAPVLVIAVALMLMRDGLEDASGGAGYLDTALSRSGLTEVALKLVAMFCVSALLYVHRDRFTFRGDVALGLLVAWGLSLVLGLESVVAVFTLPYVVLYLGFLEPGRLEWLTRPGDLSYGLYLWAFPVQQCVVSVIGPEISPLGMMALALPFTYAIAFASWRIIEAPALRLKRKVAIPLRLPSAAAAADSPA